MRRLLPRSLRYAAAVYIVLATSAADAQGSSGMCWHVPLIEQRLSAQIKLIVAGGNSARQQALHIPASDSSNVAVVADTAQCRAAAVANQRATKRDSLAAPDPVVVIHAGDASNPASNRYIVWDNTRFGEWFSAAVYDMNLAYLGGFVF